MVIITPGLKIKAMGKSTKNTGIITKSISIYNTVRKKEQFLAIPQSNRKQAFQDALRMGMASGMIICSGGLDPATHKPIEMYSAIK